MDDLKEQYYIRKPKYDGLLSAIIFTFNKLIKEASVSLFEINGRVKTIDSLIEKVSRKNYTQPFEEIEDFCGIRIVCYYLSDLDSLSSLIHEQFIVLSESDKQKEAPDDKFGYQSRHYIVTLNDIWLQAPLYKDYNGLKFEIQIRTMLMHSWAAISHKLLYKYESDAPKELKRKLNRLSALIELADEQFNAIKDIKHEYVENLQANKVDKKVPINIDGLVSIVNKYSPLRELDPESISDFIYEMQDYSLTLADFESRVLKVIDYLDELEANLAEVNSRPLPMWTIAGFLRIVMDLTLDDYYQHRWGEEADLDGLDEPESTISAWQREIRAVREKINS